MYAFTLTYSFVIPAIATVHWCVNWSTNTNPDNLYKAWNLVYPLSGLCQMFYYQTVLRRAVEILNCSTNPSMLSAWDNRINDIVFAGLDTAEDGITEIFKYKNLVETAAIFRIRPDWFDRQEDTRGHGTVLARTKKELEHEHEYIYIEDEEKRGEWLDELRVFC